MSALYERYFPSRCSSPCLYVVRRSPLFEVCFKGYPKGRSPLAQEGIFSGNGVQREENALMSYGIS